MYPEKQIINVETVTYMSSRMNCRDGSYMEIRDGTYIEIRDGTYIEIRDGTYMEIREYAREMGRVCLQNNMTR